VAAAAPAISAAAGGDAGVAAALQEAVAREVAMGRGALLEGRALDAMAAAGGAPVEARNDVLYRMRICGGRVTLAVGAMTVQTPWLGQGGAAVFGAADGGGGGGGAGEKGGGTSGSLFSTMALISGAGGQAVGAVGSSYTYDALFTADAPDMVIAGFEALFGAGGGSSALAGLIAGELSVGSFMTSLVPGPWTIAMLAIQLSGLMSCEQAEQVLAMKNDNRL
jgi:hypothetical protein